MRFLRAENSERFFNSTTVRRKRYQNVQPRTTVLVKNVRSHPSQRTFFGTLSRKPLSNTPLHRSVVRGSPYAMVGSLTIKITTANLPDVSVSSSTTTANNVSGDARHAPSDNFDRYVRRLLLAPFHLLVQRVTGPTRVALRLPAYRIFSPTSRRIKVLKSFFSPSSLRHRLIVQRPTSKSIELDMGTRLFFPSF